MSGMSQRKSMAEEVLDNQTQPSPGNAETGVVKFDKLIKLLEKTEWRDAGLDRAIARLIPEGWGRHLTGRIDDALELVPAGWKAILYTETLVAELYPINVKHRPAGIQFRSAGATLAIAICICALKARTTLSKAEPTT